MKALITSLLLVSMSWASAQSAESILAKTIQYHDPGGEWKSLKATFNFKEKQPDGTERSTIFKINNVASSYYLKRGDLEAYQINGSKVQVLLGDKGEERGKMMRNYYVYLWGLPMKLLDKGTIVKAAKSETIKGVKCHAVKVVYKKETWTYFLDQDSYRMVAYRFIKNDGTGKGENIYLEGEVKVGNLLIPKARSWHTIPENKFLGTDVLEKVESP